VYAIVYNTSMTLSRQEKKILQQQHFQKIREKSITWNECYICGKTRHRFVPVEEIPMPVCLEHS
jgi:hypothetical protein